MKIIAIGDTHGRSFWKLIKEKEEWDKFIFIGDYFDSFDIKPEEQIANFREIAKFKEDNPEKVVLLIGNHDEHYFPFMGNSGTSGYNAGAAPNYGHLLSTYKDLLQMAHSEGDVLFTHAGVGETWLKENHLGGEEKWEVPNNATEVAEFVNDVWKYKPLSFKFNGWDPTGNDMCQTPIWIRPLSLTKDSRKLRESVIQVVGHTGQHKIHLDKTPTINGRYYFIDTLGHSGEYLIIEDGQFKTGKV